MPSFYRYFAEVLIRRNSDTQVGGIGSCRSIQIGRKYYIPSIGTNNTTIFSFTIQVTSGFKIHIKPIQIKKTGSKENTVPYTDCSMQRNRLIPGFIYLQFDKPNGLITPDKRRGIPC